MHICKPAFLLSIALTLFGTLLADMGDWSAAAYYGIATVGILVYFAVFTWVEEREPQRR